MSQTGELIRELRTQKGFTMSELANKIAVSRPYLSMLENGKNFPTEELVKKLSLQLSDGSSEDIFNKSCDLTIALQKDKRTVAYNSFTHLNANPTEETYKENITLLLDTLSIEQLKEVQDYIDFRFVQPNIRAGKKKKGIE